MMADRHEMWKELGMDLEAHDTLCSVLPQAFGDIYLSQKKHGFLGYGCLGYSRYSSG